MRLMVIFGPPSVGKMTVGRAVAASSEFRLFHNHSLLEPLLEVFDFGTPPFMQLLGECRRRVIEEAAAFGTDLVLTFVWGLDLKSEASELLGYVRPYTDRGAELVFVELYADLDTRLERNGTEHRLAVKPSKRDLEWSDGNVRDFEQFVMNTGGSGAAPEPARAILSDHRHLRLDNTQLTAAESAQTILAWVHQT